MILVTQKFSEIPFNFIVSKKIKFKFRNFWHLAVGENFDSPISSLIYTLGTNNDEMYAVISKKHIKSHLKSYRRGF